MATILVLRFFASCPRSWNRSISASGYGNGTGEARLLYDPTALQSYSRTSLMSCSHSWSAWSSLARASEILRSVSTSVDYLALGICLAGLFWAVALFDKDSSEIQRVICLGIFYMQALYILHSL